MTRSTSDTFAEDLRALSHADADAMRCLTHLLRKDRQARDEIERRLGWGRHQRPGYRTLLTLSWPAGPPEVRAAIATWSMLPRVLDDIVARDGWPHPQSIDRASEARLWILLLHCDRGQRTRRRLLALARPTIADAGADPYAYALAVDRTEALHASRQVYGTMLVAPGGAFEVPLIDPREVDARRDAVGLPPLQRDLDSGITSDSIAARLASQSFDETST